MTRADVAALSRQLREALDGPRLRRVLRLAGADEIAAGAPEALGEAAADAVARRATRPEGLVARVPGRDADANVIEEARGAARRAYVEGAAQPFGLKADAVQQALALEVAAVAAHAVRYARTEGRAVDASCVAVAAAREAGRTLLERPA